jgi:hypothetical protein
MTIIGWLIAGAVFVLEVWNAVRGRSRAVA